MERLLYESILSGLAKPHELVDPTPDPEKLLNTSTLAAMRAARIVCLSPAAVKHIEPGEKQETSSRPFYLPMPFRSLWVECPMSSGGRNALYGFQVNSNAPHRQVMAVLFRKGDQTIRSTLYCYERLPGQPRDALSAYTGIISPATYMLANAPGFAHEFIFRVFNDFRKNFRIGTEDVNLRVRSGTGDDRKLVKIKDIVVIAMRNEMKSLDEQAEKDGRKIDWSHRWEVMGHWRKCPGIGKDQNNHHCVIGYTWVVPHVKGPEHKQLVTKSRFVVGQPLTHLPGQQIK